MSIVLPYHKYVTADYVPLDFGGELTPALGGPSQRINRIGNRMSITFTLPPLYSPDEGRIFVSRLMRAKTEGAISRFPQSGMRVGTPGDTRIAVNVTAGSSFTVTGGTPQYAIREGQPMSVLHDGRHYLYWSAGQVILDDNGAGVVAVYPMLRSGLTIGDIVNLGVPVIEGSLSDESDRWSKAAHARNAIQYTITEQR